ncbi:MAG: TIR domain protein [Methanocella sp. PtaU1.Bin125]|nr:MAG: TIR domain protein [Methanocella sp. PtaU1.Bin125]
MAHDVFISYSSEDKAIADAICAALESAKVRCWIAPRDILPGDTWQEAIVQAIGHSRVMVLVFSSHSNASTDVSRELTLAVRAGCVIVPFRIEAVQPNGVMRYYLADTHWLDAMNPPTEVEILKLVTTVTLFLKGERPHGSGDSPAGKGSLPLWRIIARAKAKPFYAAAFAGIVLLAVVALLIALLPPGQPPGASFAVVGNITPPAYNVKRVDLYQDTALLLLDNGLAFMDVKNLSISGTPLSFSDNETLDMSTRDNRTYVLLRQASQNLTVSGDTYRVLAIGLDDPQRAPGVLWEKTFPGTEIYTPANIEAGDDVLFLGTWNGFTLVRLGLPEGDTSTYTATFNHSGFASEGVILDNMLSASIGDLGVGLFDIGAVTSAPVTPPIMDPVHFIHAINPLPSWVKSSLRVHGDQLYFIVDRIYIYDVRDPEQPRKLADFGIDNNPYIYFSNLEIDGDILYAAFYRNGYGNRYVEGGVAAFDVSDPAFPRPVARYYTASRVTGLAARDGLVCISTSDPGLTLLRLQQWG